MARLNTASRFPQDRGPFLDFLMRRYGYSTLPEPVEDSESGAQPITFANFAGNAVGDMIRRLIEGKSVPKAEFSISISKRDVMFAFRLPRHTWRNNFSNLPPPIIRYIQMEFAENLERKVPMNQQVVETFNPQITLHTLTDRHGNPVTGAVLDQLSQQNLVRHAPLLVDLVRFTRKHMGTDKVTRVIEEGTNKVVGYRLHTSVPELTQLRGKAGQKVIEELRALMRKPMKILLRTSKYDGKIKRSAPTLTTGIIREIDVEVNKPLIVEFSSILMALEEGFKLLPDDLRKRWARFQGRRQLYHELAWAWAFQARFERHDETVDKLLERWGIEDDPVHPARKWERFDSCIKFLTDTRVVCRYQVMRRKKGNPDLVRFWFDRFELRHIELLPREEEPPRNILMLPPENQSRSPNGDFRSPRGDEVSRKAANIKGLRGIGS